MTDPVFTDIIAKSISQYIGWVLAGATAGMVSLVIKLWKCLQKQDKRTWKLGQALRLFVDLVDDKTHELHPQHPGADIKDKIKQLLGEDF